MLKTLVNNMKACQFVGVISAGLLRLPLDQLCSVWITLKWITLPFSVYNTGNWYDLE